MTRANARTPPGGRPCPIVCLQTPRTCSRGPAGWRSPSGVAPDGPFFYTLTAARANSLTCAAEAFTPEVRRGRRACLGRWACDAAGTHPAQEKRPAPVEPVAGPAPSPTSGCGSIVKDSLVPLHAAVQKRTARFKNNGLRAVVDLMSTCAYVARPKKRPARGGPFPDADAGWIRNPCRPCRPCHRRPASPARPSSAARPPSPRW